MKLRLHAAAIAILLTTSLSAVPARPGTYTFTQPDGSTFAARCIGDEFFKVKTTAQGHAVIRDDNGWWCYAEYSSDGTRRSSGHPVGKPAPAEVISRSLSIPYAVLSQNARNKRHPFGDLPQESILARVRKAQGVPVKSGDASTAKHGLVILAEYSDVKFKHGRQEFVEMLTMQGYAVNGATGSAKDYFDSQFHGMFTFDFAVSEIVTLSNRRAFYGKNDYADQDMRPAEMIEEACRLADASGTDFSLYDDDNDGYVDNVFVIFAGEDEADDPDANADCIWSHSWYVKSGAGITLELGGKTIDQYACTSELMPGNVLAGIGTFCHEFSHTLGLPDFYDTDYEQGGGWAAGLWTYTSLMDGGNQNNDTNTPPYYNAIEREIIGLSEPETISSDGAYTLEPIHENGRYLKIESDNPKEYYLLECRSNEGWDSHIGGKGLLVYHIDKTKRNPWNNNEVNADPAHQYADLIEADGRSQSLTDRNYWQLMGNISGIFFPHSSTDRITPDSKPGFTFWYGYEPQISITGIKRNGNSVTFTVSGLSGEAPPVPKELKAETFMDAAIISFESDSPFNGNALITWGKAGGDSETIEVEPYETGKYAMILEGLEPGNKTYTATVCFESGTVRGESRKISFMTSKNPPVEWPYIYLGKKAAEDGTFTKGTKIPLRVYNASEAEEIEWSFNNRTITPAGDGYFTLSTGGMLQARVYMPDGSTEILEKRIILSE